MNDNVALYESLRDAIIRLNLPKGGEDRRIYWVVDRVLGVAKTFSGATELFLIGEKVLATSSLVRRHIQHGNWRTSDDLSELSANRIVLPAEPHFLPLAALISVELVEAGLYTSAVLAQVFRKVEPLIELALRRSALAHEHILGLMGELLCLEVMLDSVTDRPEHRSNVLDMWRGHSGSLRDFFIFDTAIEVKTTQFQSSTHKFSGLHQVEPNGLSGESEQNLYLLSVGLEESNSGGLSLSELVERISSKLKMLDRAPSDHSLGPLQQRFLANVAAYGNENGAGYDHESMAEMSVYRVAYRSTYSPRLYDMLDSDFRIFRKTDLQGTYLSPDDFQFRLDLDATLSPTNPVSNWAQVISSLVRSKLGFA